MSELKKFQVNLDTDKDMKNMFVEKETEDVQSHSSSEEEDHIKIVAPRKTKKGNPIDAMLFEQTITQQKAYLKAQKTIYRLQSEIDTEEVKTRYLKLDLNNLQVKLDDELVKNKKLALVEFENMALRVVIVLYIVLRVLYRFM